MRPEHNEKMGEKQKYIKISSCNTPIYIAGISLTDGEDTRIEK